MFNNFKQNEIFRRIIGNDVRPKHIADQYYNKLNDTFKTVIMQIQNPLTCMQGTNHRIICKERFNGIHHLNRDL